MKNARLAVQQIEALLATQDFIASPTKPGFIDYSIFGRWQMANAMRPDLAKELFMVGKVGPWIERIVKRFALEEIEARTW